MSGVKEEKNIEKIRERLYARNAKQFKTPQHEFADEELRQKRKNVPNRWGQNRQGDVHVTYGKNTEDLRSSLDKPLNQGAQHGYQVASTGTNNMEGVSEVGARKPRRRYRIYLVIFSLLIFSVVGAYAVYLMNNGLTEISSRNIDISVQGPSTVGSGETVPISISIRNDNPVPIVSGTLVLDFPSGTRDANEPTRILRSERIATDSIPQGETLQIPIEAIIFGEFGERKEVGISFNYRVQGTNSILESSIEPLLVRITSSPVSISTPTDEKVVAGEEFEINLNITSNSTNNVSDLLIVAEYPSGFDFISSEPSPTFGQNTWNIEELISGGVKNIKIRGVFSGRTRDNYVMNFELGVPRDDNRLVVGSVYDTESVDFSIVRSPFSSRITINDESGQSIVTSDSRNTRVQISVTNTLDVPVYQVRLVAEVSGDAYDIESGLDIGSGNVLSARSGFFDSINNKARFEPTTDSDLSRLGPGQTKSYVFSFSPNQLKAGQAQVELEVFGRLLEGSDSQEQLLANNITTISYSNSNISLNRRLVYDGGVFENTGPNPPVAEQTTTYTVRLIAQPGINDIENAVVRTSLPINVEWLDEYTGDGVIDYNPVTKNLVWSIGSIDSNSSAEINFQVELLPSRSQIGRSPVIINSQQFTARESFTRVQISDNNGSVNAGAVRSN